MSNSNIRNQIVNTIINNKTGEITGKVLQDVLLGMFDRDVFLSEDEYDALVAHGDIDEDKIYHVYEE